MATMGDFSQPTDTRSNESESWPVSDTISILVATDNHLGCFEKDPVRGNDSIKTFEEILKIAVEEKVDMILLGGDLFHENKPSRHTLYQTMALLRQYCFGDKPCYLNFLSDQSINFQDMFATANYLDPNFNVSLPVFSIHGNHDEPCGKGSLCALDLLSVSGLVNYFGRSREIDNISLHPILLQKGATRLALYGLGNVRDERLHDTFVKGGVEVMRPREDAESWFNLLAVHQNRIAHTATSYIPEHFLESCFDLVVWGHEHECLIDPELNSNQGFYVTQPGSSIATSLMEGEAAKKHVAVVKINRTSFHLRKIPLKTVRPFVFRDFYLDDSTSDMATLTSILLEEVKKMIDEADAEYLEQQDDKDAVPPKPLIRLRVELAPSIDAISPHRFSQHLVDKVANPRDAIQFRRPKQAQGPRRSRLTQLAANTFSQPQSTAGSIRRIEDLILEVIQEYTPGIFPEKQMVETLQRAVEKDERDVLKDFMEKYEGLALNHLSKHTTTDNVDELKTSARQQTQLRRLEFGINPTIQTTPLPTPLDRPHSPPCIHQICRKVQAEGICPPEYKSCSPCF
ncbi:meiotic recombination [Entomophthora muscae]|uniref:Meiotic recombination n=1 Tax=Entomophthora muscae TaxID=34485 RepID=A0ACC2TZ25_9FUNG|nr:meiotic recombination [Entomophthora muscae]